MKITGYKKTHTSDLATTQIQQSTANSLSQLTNNPLLSGILIEDIQLIFGENKSINHGLGRKIRGYLIVKKNNAIDVWMDPAAQSLPERLLVLTPSADAIISLYVF